MMPHQAILTVFGLGLLRPAPGTWGSLPPPLLALLILAAGQSSILVNVVLLATAGLFSVACIVYGSRAERSLGREDPPQVVADEVAGQCVALLLLPWGNMDAGGLRWNVALAATAFIAFRFFDILKPPPIGRLQRLPAGWGILADDLAAGLCAAGVTHGLIWFIYL